MNIVITFCNLLNKAIKANGSIIRRMQIKSKPWSNLYPVCRRKHSTLSEGNNDETYLGLQFGS